MIKINLSPEQIKEAQENHWNWFKNEQFPKLVKKEKSCTNDKLKNYFSELIRNEQRLRNIVIGRPSCIRAELQYVIDNYSELISDCENDDVDETVEKELKEIKRELPTQKSIVDDNWKAEYEKLYKLILKSVYFDINDFKECTCKTHVQKLISNVRNRINSRNVHDIITSVFSYKDFSDKKNNIWNAYDWVKFLNLKTCPYCNRQFIHFHVEENENIMRPALDHFIPKGLYPFLSVSLFNLIPSCHVCNSSFKGEIDFYLKKHINPFEESFGKAGIFETDFKRNGDGTYNIDYLTSVKKSEKFDLFLTVKTDDEELRAKICQSNETFKIDRLYQNHKDYAHEIIKKTHMYNNTRLKELMESFGGQLFDSKEELKQLIMGNYLNPEQQGDRVLAKLTQDIFDEFKIEEIWDDAIKDEN